MVDFYQLREKCLCEFATYLHKNLTETEFLLWWSVLENNCIKLLNDINEPLDNGKMIFLTSRDERAWMDAVNAFSNLTEKIRKGQVG